MSKRDLRIQATSPAFGVTAVRPVRAERPVVIRGIQPLVADDPSAQPPSSASVPETAAVATGGSLRAAYAQVTTDASTQEVVMHLRDAVTGEVLREVTSGEVRKQSRELRAYADAHARQMAAPHDRTTE